MSDWMSLGFSGGGVAASMMVLLWLVSLRLRDSSIVDIFWGAGFVLLNWYYFLHAPEVGARQWLMGALVTFWGVRLSLHIGVRNSGHGEDARYRQWRSQSPRHWWWISLFQVFLLQGLLMWVIAVPLLAAQAAPQPAGLTPWDMAAIPLWLLGFVFESVGDWQLARFRSDPSNKGKVMDRGLWRYSRHPNYFGDAVQWWAFFLIAASTEALWWSLPSPVLMTFLLMRVSGVTLLERSLKETRPGYAEYIRSTSAFFPWPPRRSA